MNRSVWRAICVEVATAVRRMSGARRLERIIVFMIIEGLKLIKMESVQTDVTLATAVTGGLGCES